MRRRVRIVSCTGRLLRPSIGPSVGQRSCRSCENAFERHRAALASMDASSRARGELGALVALVRTRCSEQPLALALEDAHWAEPEALSLWCQLVACPSCRESSATTAPSSTALGPVLSLVLPHQVLEFVLGSAGGSG